MQSITPSDGFMWERGFGEEAYVPYAVNEDLPNSVRYHLPEHAQDIFRAAFNHAYSAHKGDPRQEEAAFRIAWAAVERRYRKDGDVWVREGRVLSRI